MEICVSTHGGYELHRHGFSLLCILAFLFYLFSHSKQMGNCFLTKCNSSLNPNPTITLVIPRTLQEICHFYIQLAKVVIPLLQFTPVSPSLSLSLSLSPPSPTYAPSSTETPRARSDIHKAISPYLVTSKCGGL